MNLPDTLWQVNAPADGRQPGFQRRFPDGTWVRVFMHTTPGIERFNSCEVRASSIYNAGMTSDWMGPGSIIEQGLEFAENIWGGDR